MMKRYDLHTHSCRSDGRLTPAALVHKAKEEGVLYLALTDHDTTAGIEEAAAAGNTLGVKVLPGIELDVEADYDLHLLGLGIRPEAMAEYAEKNLRRRKERNLEILKKLRKAGLDVVLPEPDGVPTRLHMAEAIVAAGYAGDIAGAFSHYLVRGAPGYAYSRRIESREAMELIHRAGGVAVLAHPCKLKCDDVALIRRLANEGLNGIEAFYPAATAGQRSRHTDLARQMGLLVTCGSDFHGGSRPETLGVAWENTPLLAPAFAAFFGEP